MKVTVEVGGDEVGAKWEQDEQRITIQLDKPVVLDPQTPLAVRIRFPE